MHFSSFHGHMQDSGNTFTYLLLFGSPPRGLFFPKVGKHFCQRGQKISSWQKEGSQIVNVADILDSFAHDNDDCPFNETSASKPHNFAICFEFRHKMIIEEFMTFHLQPVFWDSTENGGFQGIQQIWRSNHHWSSRYDTSIRPGLDWWNFLLNFLPECIAKGSRLWVDWASCVWVFFETSKHFFTQKAKTRRPEHSRNSNCANEITSMPGRLEILKSMGLAEIWQIQIFLEL